MALGGLCRVRRTVSRFARFVGPSCPSVYRNIISSSRRPIHSLFDRKEEYTILQMYSKELDSLRRNRKTVFNGSRSGWGVGA